MITLRLYSARFSIFKFEIKLIVDGRRNSVGKALAHGGKAKRFDSRQVQALLPYVHDDRFCDRLTKEIPELYQAYECESLAYTGEWLESFVAKHKQGTKRERKNLTEKSMTIITMINCVALVTTINKL